MATAISHTEATRIQDTVSLSKPHQQPDEVNMMRLYQCTTDTGCSEFLLTTDEQRAIQLFTTFIVLSETGPTRLSIREVTLATVLPERRQHLAEALAHGIEAFASYELESGWVMTLVQSRFDQLSDAAREGAGVQ